LAEDQDDGQQKTGEWLEMVGQFVVKMGDWSFFQGNIKKRLASLKKNTSSTNIYKHLPLGNVHLVPALLKK
jgi:arginine utilization protein RocB